MRPSQLYRVRAKLAQIADSQLPDNQNLTLAPVLPDPAEGNASPMLISGPGDPALIPEENRKVDQALSPNAETQNIEVTRGHLARHFTMADVPVRKKPNTGNALQERIADHMGEANVAAHKAQMAVPDAEQVETFDKVAARFPHVMENLRRVDPGAYYLRKLANGDEGGGEKPEEERGKKTLSAQDKSVIQKYLSSQKGKIEDEEGVHELAESMGLNVHEVESYIYGLARGNTKTARIRALHGLLKRAQDNDVIPGGKAAGKPSSEYSAEQIRMGVKVEKEHTPSKAKAEEIARDHLEEFPDYYTRLKKMEHEAEKAKEKKAFLFRR